ncbi:hypothetical protein MRB53_009233 [Persea americana]|uniref:Uncharacterized protein n=1 Tax=Persea americana TaxID=3435 RepID=A0ACC2LNH5_PERAE|nr:hypothetical protein MRB53_009233 [Persea americana]
MSRDDQTINRCISHLDPPPTPPIPSSWEDKRGKELLNHLYAKLINGEWGNKAEYQLRRLYLNVRLSGESDDVTEDLVRHLREIASNNREWSSEMEKLADDLYTKVMNKEWDDVIKIYKEQKKEMIQVTGITPSKQTALHIAISNSQTNMVEKLLDNIDALAIREMTDNRKENPLHLAASMGQLETCERLVEKDPELIGAQNAHCKRDDGNTILHVSIRGEYFKLAYQIIHWYPELIKDLNNDGQTALHLLAENPSAFKSGCYLGPVDDFIYSCLIVDSDKVGTPSDFTGKHFADIAGPAPQNYQTCLDLLNLGKRVFKLLVTWARTWKEIKSDVCKIFSRNIDRLPVKNTIPGERPKTSNRDPIQDEMSHDSSKHCQREHIGMKGDKTEPQKGPRKEEGSSDSTPQKGNRIQRASQMEKEDSTERPQVVGGLWGGGTGSRPDTVGDAVSILPPHVESDDHSKEAIPDQNEICQDVSASTSNNPPRPDGFAGKYNISPILVAAKNGVFVRKTMPHYICTTHRNKGGMTSVEVFNEAHKTMLKEGVKWLTNTAQSCSVVAALVATVAYASATTVPGGVENGIPLLRNTYAFSIFTISSLVALCLSVTSLTMFLSILTSRNEISDFHHNLPMKLIMGLSSLFISIAAMLVSFCGGHFFDLAGHLQHTAFPIYAVTCLPVSIYAATQFPLYFDLIKSIIITVPKRNN